MIYVIEDDESIRELIKLALLSFSYDVREFESAEDALREIARALPDLVIFDIMLPGISGIQAIKLLRQSPETKKLPMLLLTAKGSEMDKVTGLDAGADDYIVKPFSVMELAARLRAVLRRLPEENAAPAEPQVYEFPDFTVNHSTREVTRSGEVVHLTFKEYELLKLLIREKNRIVPREELLNSVWGEDFLGESRTIDMHIRTLRQKLGDDAENPKYIKTVRNVGYRFTGESL
ncbi:MAG: response regulator transcription factor [Oscillospiraceae bacterium]|jgi:two-component system alkaline phosphatase synthesis response regulator PhoP|nr:response regulator transcription factor [Oscillospiraceae bacterium]